MANSIYDNFSLYYALTSVAVWHCEKLGHSVSGKRSERKPQVFAGLENMGELLFPHCITLPPLSDRLPFKNRLDFKGYQSSQIRFIWVKISKLSVVIFIRVFGC